MISLQRFTMLILTILITICFLVGFSSAKNFTENNATADWKMYSNPETNFTFKYPQDWEIISDFFYETAGGFKSNQRTVELQKVGDNDSDNWIRINPRQFQYNYGKCIKLEDEEICTYSINQEVLEVLRKISASFTIKPIQAGKNRN